MFVALNHTQLTTKDEEVANSMSLLFNPINAVKTPKTLNSSSFKIIHFKKKDYKAHSNKFRFMFDN